MANRNFYRDESNYNKAVVTLEGSFDATSSNPVTNVLGVGFTVSHTAGGTYTITLADGFPALLDFHCDLQLGAAPANAPFAVPGPATGTKAPGGTLVIYTFNAGGTTIQDPAAGCRVNFAVVFRNLGTA
jgi:hypothetical protein